MHRFPPLDAIRRPARPRRAREGMSIRTRILLIAAIVLLPAALALGWRLTQELQQSRDDARLTVSVLRDNAAAHVAKTLREADLLLAHLSQSRALAAGDPDACAVALDAAPMLSPAFQGLELRDVAGTPVCASTPPPSPLPRASVDRTLARHPDDAPGAALGAPFRDEHTGHLLVALGRPVSLGNGARGGALFVVIDLHALGEELAADSAGGAGVVSVVAADGTLLLRTRDDLGLAGRPTGGGQTAGQAAGFLEATGLDGVDRLYAFKTLADPPWRVFAGLPRANVYAPYEAALRRTAVLGAVVLALAFGSAWRLARQITQPVEATRSAVRRVAAGDFNTHVLADGLPELDDMVADFNSMVDTLVLSQSRLYALFETMSEAVLSADETHAIVMANPAAADLFGCPLESLIGSKVEDWVPPRYRAQHRADMRAFGDAASGPRTMGHRPTLTALRADGREFPIEASISLLHVQGQRYFTVVLRDVGEQRRAMTELASSKAMLDAALASMSDAVFICDLHGDFVAFNDAFASFHRFASRAGCPASLRTLAASVELVDDAGRPLPSQTWVAQRALAGESGTNALCQMRRRDTGERWTGSFSYAPVRGADGEISGCVVTARDVTQTLAAQHELEHSHAALRRLVAALDRAQDDERKRIARELHDDLQQTLAAIGMEAAAAGPVLAEQPAPVRRALERVQVLASTALLSTRRIIADLRPQVLEELGLVAALRNLAEVHATRHGMPCDVEIDDALENLVLSPSVSGCLYRVAQEALNNIAKHARAGSVAIVLHQLPGGDLRLHVLDDGCGLASGADAKPQAFGLLGMSERVHAVGGRLRVYSSAQAGTVVEAILPLDVHPTDSPAPTPI